MSLSGNASTDNLLVGEVRGLNSIHGKSAYELAVIHGFEGTEEEWIASLKGEKGDTYTLTEADKEEIADKVAVDNLKESAEKYIDSVIETKDLEVTRTATGNAITIDSANAPLQNLKLFGKTEQDGTPTPDNPIELKSVGDSGSYSVDLYGKNLFNINGNVNLWGNSGIQTNLNSVSNNILTSNADVSSVNGVGQKIKVNVGDTITFSAKAIGIGTGSSVRLAIYDNGNLYAYQYGGLNKILKLTYTAKTSDLIFTFGTSGGTGAQFTDIQVEYGTEVTPYEPYKAKQTFTNTDILRGVGGIADEKDFARGVKTQRTREISLAVADMNLSESYPGWSGVSDLGDCFEKGTNGIIFGVCSNIGSIIGVNTNTVGNEQIFLPTGTYGLTQTEWKTKYPDLVVKFIFPLLTPIETPLTEQEVNDYRQLMTNKGTTTILSEADMEVDYYINKPNAQAIGNIHSQLNKDYFKLQQAIISTGGN